MSDPIRLAVEAFARSEAARLESEIMRIVPLVVDPRDCLEIVEQQGRAPRVRVIATRSQHAV